MIIVKHAIRNMVRNKGRNILIGIIITIITLCTCIALAIHQAGENLVQTYKDTNPLAVSFSLNMNELRSSSDDEKNDFQSLSIEDIKQYGDSELVKDYYYMLESSLSSDSLEAVDDNVRPDAKEDGEEDNDFKRDNARGEAPVGSIGDFRITAYSDFSYLDDFISGNKKIVDGVMVSGDSSDNEIVISESLAEDNEIEVGSEVTFYLPDNEDITYTFVVVGIFEDSSDDNSSGFMNINVLNSSNQMYANIHSVEEILEDMEDDDSQLIQSNGLSASFYLTDNDLLDEFEEEVRNKGLSDYYTVSTNESEIMQQLEPIQNIVSFSVQFLVVILVIGIVVLTIINFLNIRDRKYEIGVLRAIGMSKFKVCGLLILEIFFVAFISLVLGTSSGSLLAQPVTNKILEQEITSYTESTMNTQRNFGDEGFERPSQNVGGENGSDIKAPDDSNFDERGGKNADQIITDYVDSLTVHISPSFILELFGISILLIVGSSAVACLFVNKYNPNTILQNRN